MIINGKEVSKKIKENVKEEVSKLEVKPKLVVVYVGDDPASQVYVNNKEKACKACGIESETIRLAGNISQSELNAKIDMLNKDENVNGILVQLPLPSHLSQDEVINKISPEKDVDGLTILNQGKLMLGQKSIVPCTPKGVIHLLKEYNIDIVGKNALVLGRSILVGKPVAQLLLKENATVTMAHSKTKNLCEISKNADIIVCAIGKPKFLKKEMVKDGVVVIDVGINRLESGLVGDADFENLENVASYITPVPGGVGPMTIACLMENVLDCYKMQKGM